MYLESIIYVSRKLTNFIYLESELLAVCRADDNSVHPDVS
jgi:hypothetical protein